MHSLVMSPSHFLPCEIHAPTLSDPIGGGAKQFRRQWENPKRGWQMSAPPMEQNRSDPIIGFYNLHQGDTPFWFDGAGFGDILEPILIGIGTGSRTDWFLGYNNVFAPTVVVYVNGNVVSDWTVTESSGLLRFGSAPGLHAQIKAKFRCKYKVVFGSQGYGGYRYERVFRHLDDATKSLYRMEFYLEEVA